ncbi:type II toxin-antitoxin system HicB family antitoxin [Candidatus Sumerlaeota bacterium]|nr:type II toxin-antitoxin system HicB family antitoxin [Candidatus Sumerlaeota bacterium]
MHLEPAEEGGYTVTVPALPGCVTEGDTYEEALEMSRDAITLYLETLIEDGEPIPVEEPPLAAHVTVAGPRAG